MTSRPAASVRPAEHAPRTHLTTRAKARKRALDILFEAELRGRDVMETLHERAADADPPVREFTRELVEGVETHRDTIDARLAACLSDDWTLERMPRVDRVACRLALFELDHTDVDARVAVSEAVALVGDLSTDDSPAFVNGVLGRAAETRPTAAD